MKLVFHEPASGWQEAIPLGNGRIGAMISGGTKTEIIYLNEETLWSGHPAEMQCNLPSDFHLKLKQFVDDKKYDKATEYIETYSKHFQDCQMYVPFGNLKINFLGEQTVSQYERELDLNEAVCNIHYHNHGASYVCRSFCSYPEQVLVYEIHSEEDFSVCINFEGGYLYDWDYDGEYLLGYGECPGRNRFTVTEGIMPETKPYFSEEPKEKGMRYLGMAKIMSDGEAVRKGTDGIYCENAKNLVIYLAIRSSFQGYNKHPYLEGDDEKMKCLSDLKMAETNTADQLFGRHKDEYQTYFNRVHFRLSDENEENEKYTFMFHYGRYLLISSSRPGTLAANGQGIWNKERIPPWNSYYTVNINAQMNYWLTGPCDLLELDEPFITLNEEMTESGRWTAANYFSCKGMACGSNVDIWRKTSPAHGSAMWSYWPYGAAWMTRNLYEHFLFGRDAIMLQQRIYPLLRENVRFCLDMLRENGGALVTAPGTSPENEFIWQGTPASVAGYTENNMAIVRNLFRDYLECCHYLNIKDDLVMETQEAFERLAPVRVGKQGQILEWSEELEEADLHHRHLSHLYELHPGRGINAEWPELMEAAKISLLRRGVEGSGWSKAWKILMWARLQNGQKAAEAAKSMLYMVRETQEIGLAGGIYPNMLCAHPPFQIDGNFGFTAGIAEMLLQSHSRKILILPAIPDEWSKGEVKGLLARGNIKIDISWGDGVIVVSLSSRLEQQVTLQFPNGSVKMANIKKNEEMLMKQKLTD